MSVLWALKLFPWELNSPHWAWFRTWTWPCWIFPCMAAFLSTMTSSSNESKLSLLCLPHTLARDVRFLLVLAFAFFTAVITKTWILFPRFCRWEVAGRLKIHFLGYSVNTSPSVSPPSLPAPSGHVFNMPHDNVKACEEVFGKLKDNHMMSPTLIQIDRSRPWSVCSAAIITEFLDRGHG